MKATKVHLALLALLVSGIAGASERSDRPDFSRLLSDSADFCEKTGSLDRSCIDRLDYYFGVIYEMDETDLSTKIDERAILDIAELLKSDYPKLFRAARILGAMGKRATVALPSLRAAEVEAGVARDLDSLIGSEALQKSLRLDIQRIEGKR
ncbi:hypothetical protein [Xanthomonas sp. LMG 12462]|uniref:hypothetical protein n=1 Tax=Xanthomonas sp. LMG 12462 TaxID=1591134 RepID=UPI001D03B135|nr:hypothetical protein [Xanthomonas sp. LMG 12462]